MLIGDLKTKNGVWYNDTGSPVSLNPPGITVAPGQSIKIYPSGSVAILPAEVPAPTKAPLPAAKPKP